MTKREPAGVPTGGQFAVTVHAETDMQLDPEDHPERYDDAKAGLVSRAGENEQPRWKSCDEWVPGGVGIRTRRCGYTLTMFERRDGRPSIRLAPHQTRNIPEAFAGMADQDGWFDGPDGVAAVMVGFPGMFTDAEVADACDTLASEHPKQWAEYGAAVRAWKKTADDLISQAGGQKPEARDGYPSGTSTPWGKPNWCYDYGVGIKYYSCPGHGGFHVSAGKLAKMSPALAQVGENGWFEEDCEWAAVALSFPERFTENEVEAACRDMQRWYRSSWASFSAERNPV